jgi:hypothetical protein
VLDLELTWTFIEREVDALGQVTASELTSPWAHAANRSEVDRDCRVGGSHAGTALPDGATRSSRSVNRFRREIDTHDLPAPARQVDGIGARPAALVEGSPWHAARCQFVQLRFGLTGVQGMATESMSHPVKDGSSLIRRTRK